MPRTEVFQAVTNIPFTLRHAAAADVDTIAELFSVLLRLLVFLPNPLELWCFQANSRARRFYEARGFRAICFTDGAANEENVPDTRYCWERPRIVDRSIRL